MGIPPVASAPLTPEERRAWADTYENWNWINAHPEILELHRGEYIAIWEQRVIGHHSDPSALGEELRSSAYWDRALLVFRVPTREEADSVLIL